MLSDANYYFYIFVPERSTLGFAIVYAPENSEYCLLEYMAVESGGRSRGYGGKLFNSLTEAFNKRSMVIEVESPYQPSEDHEIRVKRIVFYSRNGSLRVEHLKYILPLEAQGEPPEMLILLHSNIYKDFVPKYKLMSWIKDIYIKVYGCNASDKRLSTMEAPLPDKVLLIEGV